MTQIEKPKGKAPDFKGDGVAIWVNKDKNNKQYLSVKLLGSITVNCFAQEIKEPEQKTNNAELDVKHI